MNSSLHDLRGRSERLPESPGMTLRAASWLYGWGARLHDVFFRLLPVTRTRAALISVGNLELGGTGKTPAVAALAKLLRQRRPALLTGRPGGPRGVILSGSEAFEREAPDEARLLAAHFPDLPLAAARPKRAGAAQLDQGESSVILLDDGFQHRRLARRLDLVLLSGEVPLENRRVLPAGPLRERPATALERADAFLLPAGAPLPGNLPGRPVFRFRTRATGLFDLAGRKKEVGREEFIAVSAIARPERFEESAAGLVALRARVRFRDHAPWTPSLRDSLARFQEKYPGLRPLLTEKDAHRWRRDWDLPGFDPYYLGLSLEWEDGPALAAWIRERIGGS